MKATSILFMLALPLGVIAQGTKNFVDQNFIEVNGQAIVKVVPDQIYLRIQISEKQKNHDNMEAKEKEMLKRLAGIGIDLAKDMVVKDLASNFRVRIFSDDNVVISKAFLLCVHDAKTANNVIAELEKVEISNVVVDHLDHSKLSDFKKECSIQAMIASKSKAEYLAQSIGQSVGRALYIEELQLHPMPASSVGNVVFYGEKINSESLNRSDLDFDEIRLNCTILARFELK